MSRHRFWGCCGVILGLWIVIIQKAGVSVEELAESLQEYSTIKALSATPHKRGEELQTEKTDVEAQVRAMAQERDNAHQAIIAVKNKALKEVMPAERQVRIHMDSLVNNATDWGHLKKEAAALGEWVRAAQLLKSGPESWNQLPREVVQHHSPKQLQAEMGSGAADIAEIISEVRDKLPGLEKPPPNLEPEQARFRLFDSITIFLKNTAQSQPLMLVLDGLHWADRSSLLLLEFLAREIQSSPLLVVGTYRDVEVSRRHPLSETLGSLMREERFLRVQLSGLAEPEVEQLIQMSASVSLPPGLSATIHQRTEGNPLFVTEIIRTLPGEGIEKIKEGRDYTASIPEGVRDAIGRRLNRLSEGCNQVLTTASVIGRGFELGQLSRLIAEYSEENLLETLEEGLGASIIEEVPGSATGFQFCHALIQETLAGELSAARRVRLHARIGEALEELYGSGAEGHAAELAHHFAEAEPVLGPEKLVRYSLVAGERALAAYAHEDAQAHFQRGLVAKVVPLEGTEPAKDAEAAALLFGLGRAQAATPGQRRFATVATMRRLRLLC